MLNNPGKKIFSSKFPDLAIQILGSNQQFFEALYFGGKINDA